MRIGWPGAVAAIALTTAPCRLPSPLALGIFPDDVSGRPQGGSNPLSAGGLFPGDDTSGEAAQQPASLGPQDLVGFWTIFDDLATEDTMNQVAKGGSAKMSLFSAPLILRADGQTSRGSDFPGGEWSLSSEVGSDGVTRRRLSIILRSRLLRQEWRYEGLLFALELDSGMPGSFEELSAGASGAQPPSPPPPLSPPSAPQVRVVGQSNRWDMSDPNAPKVLGKPSSFSMVKKEVDRVKLTPTIKPLALPVDPEDVRVQSELNRLRDRSEEEDIQRAIDDVRRIKAEHGENWRDADELKEGVDYWKLGDDMGDELGNGAGGRPEGEELGP